MSNISYIAPRGKAAAVRSHPSSQKKESIDDYLARLEDKRLRKDLDPRLRRAIEVALGRMVQLVETAYQINEASSDFYSTSSGPSQAPSGGSSSDAVGDRVTARLHQEDQRGRPLRRNNPLDRYMRQTLVNEFGHLTRSISTITSRAVEALYGRTNRRAKLNAEQVADIRRRQAENHTSLANEFAVSPATIRQVVSGRTWKESE